MSIKGYRNSILGLCYMVSVVLMAYWQTESLPALAGTYGASVAGIIFGRGYNKKQENGK